MPRRDVIVRARELRDRDEQKIEAVQRTRSRTDSQGQTTIHYVSVARVRWIEEQRP